MNGLEKPRFTVRGEGTMSPLLRVTIVTDMQCAERGIEADPEGKHDASIPATGLGLAQI